MDNFDWIIVTNYLIKVANHEYKLYNFKQLYNQILIHT